MKEALKSVKGFTLVELMVVIVIIGILAAVSIQVYKAHANAAIALEAKNIFSAFNRQAKIAQAQYGAYNMGSWGSDNPAIELYNQAKYFNGGMGVYGLTKTGYIFWLSAGSAGAPFNKVTLTHEDGNPDTVAVDPPDIPGVGPGW